MSDCACKDTCSCISISVFLSLSIVGLIMLCIEGVKGIDDDRNDGLMWTGLGLCLGGFTIAWLFYMNIFGKWVSGLVERGWIVRFV